MARFASKRKLASENAHPDTAHSTIRDLPRSVSASQEVSQPNAAEMWDWYLRTGFGVLTLSASLITALILVIAAKKDLSTAFTVASWVLVAGALLAVTVKACLWERPRRREEVGSSP